MQAAPLAHASVLENEIRTIAMRQGVEGHRAVVRKFSELLLARGEELSASQWSMRLHRVLGKNTQSEMVWPAAVSCLEVADMPDRCAGIISQAQVVLAFSTVGEIFQGMQNAYRGTLFAP